MFGVTYKSVSKWECGICLPDASLFVPLCDILDIQLQELFDES
ncbi:helix-turn-helix domain-containing protein [Candidatus Stoquefichus massiliensis]|nr:helix-turn-helix transcriptional regulator [Candidatus Stoquefichus massiliensis]